MWERSGSVSSSKAESRSARLYRSFCIVGKIRRGLLFLLVLYQGIGFSRAATTRASKALATVDHILVWHVGAALASALGGMAIGTIAEYSGSRH